jgi:hypothetical protein
MAIKLSLSGLLVVLLAMLPAASSGDEHHLQSCRAFYGRLSDLDIRRPPKRVLLIPLLSRDPHTNESPRWSEQPARQLRHFYRQQFGSNVVQLQNTWSWSDYYRQVNLIIDNGASFDRVIFISHGGFDGPVLKNAVFFQNLDVNGDQGTLTQLSEAQPGLMNSLTITYDVSRNSVFSDYMVSHWPELSPMKSSDIWQLLTGLEKQIVPLNRDCYNRYCSANRLAESPDAIRQYRLDLCELICRKSLFKMHTSVEISQDRFYHFAKSLTSLTAESGLVFFGACNPGSAAPKKIVESDDTDYLVNSPLLGGPYQTYVHLISTATGRITAGPIGQSSAEDIVNRIMLFEQNRSHRNLCIATPPQH